MLSLSYGIIGNGKVANHFSHYFNLLNIPVVKWSRTTVSNTENPSLKSLFSSCHYILILISYDSIGAFIDKHT